MYASLTQVARESSGLCGGLDPERTGGGPSTFV